VTITEAITHLERLKEKSRGDVEVFFDCPHCGISTAPDRIDLVVERPTAKLRGRVISQGLAR
jgi:hypothetical protein